ncbi:glycine cleavage system aminomethyltransferase GcvT [candidate division KSB1 bacterium]
MDIKKTALYGIHEKNGGKMIEFAGYYMPVQYTNMTDEHKCVRTKAGVFDVSHMGEFTVKGDKALDFVQKVTINDVSKLFYGRVQYSAFCYNDGGIVDDLLVYRMKDHYLLVVNAANMEKDFKWLQSNNTEGIELENISDEITQLAVQGPRSIEILQKLTDINLEEVKYYHFLEGVLAGEDMIISRTGYTGEPGFELYFKTDISEKIWDEVFKAGEEFGIQPIGLGARDTLRLEKGFCLYGNDISKDTNPIEAGLGWITKVDKGDFIGKSAIMKVKEEGVTRRLKGFISEERAIPRHGYRIFRDGEDIGEVTSGTLSPMLSKAVGMGYIKKEFAGEGTKIQIQIRNKFIDAEIVKPPFV